MLDYLINLDPLLIFIVLIFCMFTNGIILFPSSQVLLIVAGILSSVLGLNYILLFFLMWLSNLVSNYLLYHLSLKYGESLIFRYIPMNKKRLKEDVLVTKYLFKHYGELIVFVGRNLPLFHSVISIPAGVSKMRSGVFLLYTGLGILTWNVMFFALGFYFGTNYENLFGTLNLVLLSLTIIITLYSFYFVRKFKKKFLKRALEEKGVV